MQQKQLVIRMLKKIANAYFAMKYGVSSDHSNGYPQGYPQLLLVIN
jgi:hypothetical protein